MHTYIHTYRHTHTHTHLPWIPTQHTNMWLCIISHSVIAKMMQNSEIQLNVAIHKALARSRLRHSLLPQYPSLLFTKSPWSSWVLKTSLSPFTRRPSWNVLLQDIPAPSCHGAGLVRPKPRFLFYIKSKLPPSGCWTGVKPPCLSGLKGYSTLLSSIRFRVRLLV